MDYASVKKARFLARPNRFIARCQLEGQEVLAHVPNTGRCKELLLPGCTVYLRDYRGEKERSRKTDFSLLTVEKGPLLINMDSQAPNRLAWEGLEEGRIRLPLEAGEELLSLRREVCWGKSRFDLLAHTSRRDWYVEVKGVTLEEEGIARFPDAPTERGLRHVQELCRVRKEGCGAALLFIVQLKGPRRLEPNWQTHRAFGEALRQAQAAGVALLCYDCVVSPEQVTVSEPLPISLEEKL